MLKTHPLALRITMISFAREEHTNLTHTLRTTLLGTPYRYWAGLPFHLQNCINSLWNIESTSIPQIFSHHSAAANLDTADLNTSPTYIIINDTTCLWFIFEIVILKYIFLLRFILEAWASKSSLWSKVFDPYTQCGYTAWCVFLGVFSAERCEDWSLSPEDIHVPSVTHTFTNTHSFSHGHRDIYMHAPVGSLTRAHTHSRCGGVDAHVASVSSLTVRWAPGNPEWQLGVCRMLSRRVRNGTAGLPPRCGRTRQMHARKQTHTHQMWQRES